MTYLLNVLNSTKLGISINLFEKGCFDLYKITFIFQMSKCHIMPNIGKNKHSNKTGLYITLRPIIHTLPLLFTSIPIDEINISKTNRNSC